MVMPLQPSLYASEYAISTSAMVAACEKLIVLLTALSVWRWKAACIRTCHSGVVSCAVTNTRCHFAGTRASPWMLPPRARSSMSSLL